jgi:hypothetical protein
MKIAITVVVVAILVVSYFIGASIKKSKVVKIIAKREEILGEVSRIKGAYKEVKNILE